MTVPAPDLRDRLAEAIRAEWSQLPDGRSPQERIADAVLAVVQPELDRLAAERDGHRSGREQLRAISRDHRAKSDRYRSAWLSARQRAQAYGEGILRHVEDRDTWKGWEKEQAARVTWLAQAHNDALDLIIRLSDERDALREHLDFLRAAVDLIRRADISSEQILLGLDDGQRIYVAVNVSDVFAWGCSDAECITPDRLPVLERAWLDCKEVDADEWTVELYAARVRGMRPQGAAYPKEAAVAALLDACGPERAVGLGNPRKPPVIDDTPKETS